MQKNSKKTILFKTQHHLLLLLFAVVFLLYGRTISYDYAIDDDLVTQNHQIVQKGIKAIPEIFTSYYYMDKKMQFGYRPMVMVSFAIEHQFFGQNPHWSHFFNLLIYVLIGVLLFVIIKKIFHIENMLFPSLVVLLFLVHPVHTEVVCSIKSRDELLSFMFSLLALRTALHYVDTRKLYLIPIVMLFFVTAIFSKQTSYTFFAVIPLSLFYYEKGFNKKVQWLIIGALFIGVVLASLPRFLMPPVIREIHYFENPLVTEGNLLNRLAMAFYIIPFYIKLLLVPYPLVFYYGYNMIPIPSFTNPVVLIGLIGSVVLAVWALFKMKKHPVFSFAILFFFLTISLFLNILEPVAGIVAERFVFFASFSYVLVLALLFFIIFKQPYAQKKILSLKRNKILLSALILVIPYAAGTYIRAGHWKNHNTLYEGDISQLSHSALANAVYADLLINDIFNDISLNKQPPNLHKNLELALKHYKLSVEVYPGYFSSYNNIAFIYYQFYKDYNSALPFLEKAISLRPDYTEAYFNRAYCYQMLGQPDSALFYYNQTIALDPEFIQAYYNMSDVFLMKKDTISAININEKLKSAAPESDVPYINLGKIFLSLGDTIKSISNFEMGSAKDPDNKELILQLQQYFEYKGDAQKALYYYNLYQ